MRGMVCVTTEPVEEQGSFWDHQTPGWSSLWSRSGGKDGFPDPHTPGCIWLWSPNREYESFSNHCQERTSRSHCLLLLVRLERPSGRSQAVGTDQAEGVQDVAGVTLASLGVTRRCPAKVEPNGPYVFLWAGLDQGCLRNHSGGVRGLKIEGKQVILRIYGF